MDGWTWERKERLDDERREVIEEKERITLGTSELTNTNTNTVINVAVNVAYDYITQP